MAQSKKKQKKSASNKKTLKVKKTTPKKNLRSGQAAKKTSSKLPKATTKKVAAKSTKKNAAAPLGSRSQAPKKTFSADLIKVLTPLDDRVLVSAASEEKVTPGGLIIPDTVSGGSEQIRARVLLVGRGHKDKKGRIKPMDVRVGDEVVFADHSASKIRLQNEDFLIVRETDILGVITK